MEKRAVANTSSLIFLAKLDAFNLTKNLFSKILIPKEVVNEIFEKDFPENTVIAKELQKFLKEVKVRNIKELSLGEGEKAALSLCLEKNIKTFLSDDKKARKFARSLGLSTIGVVGVLLGNLKHKKLKKEKCLKIINKLVDKGHYISPRLYSKLMRLIHESQE